jgi:hypothetical protein
MASTPQAFWQTLLAATSGASEVLVGTTASLDAIYKDIEPVETGLGQTLNVPVPSSVNGQVTQANGDPVFSDYTVNTVPISLTLHPQYGTKIRSFDQYNSPVMIRNVLIDPGVKAVAEQANANVTALFTSGHLNVNSVVSTTGSAISPQQFVQGGFQVLLQNKVNVWDSQSMSFLQAPAVYSTQLQTANWTQESIAGINVAQQARVEGGIKIAYGARQLTDQATPQSGSSGSFVYTSVYMSKFAIAGVFRPLPAGDEKVSYTTYVFWKGIPIRITLGFSVQLDAWLLNIDMGMGIAVVRPEQAVLFSTAQ